METLHRLAYFATLGFQAVLVGLVAYLFLWLFLALESVITVMS